jgi:hypothetical protein
MGQQPEACGPGLGGGPGPQACAVLPHRPSVATSRGQWSAGQSEQVRVTQPAAGGGARVGGGRPCPAFESGLTPSLPAAGPGGNLPGPLRGRTLGPDGGAGRARAGEPTFGTPWSPWARVSADCSRDPERPPGRSRADRVPVGCPPSLTRTDSE